ncbi:hypothetical protein [Paracoccus aminovorans]|nr:hypothetical protein [Paracoccus aminovorans]
MAIEPENYISFLESGLPDWIMLYQPTGGNPFRDQKRSEFQKRKASPIRLGERKITMTEYTELELPTLSVIQKDFADIADEAEHHRPKGMTARKWLKHYYCAQYVPISPRGILIRLLVLHGSYVRYSAPLQRFIVYRIDPKTKHGDWIVVDADRIVNLLLSIARDLPKELETFERPNPEDEIRLRMFGKAYTANRSIAVEGVGRLRDHLATNIIRTKTLPQDDAVSARKLVSKMPAPELVWV